LSGYAFRRSDPSWTAPRFRLLIKSGEDRHEYECTPRKRPDVDLQIRSSKRPESLVLTGFTCLVPVEQSWPNDWQAFLVVYNAGVRSYARLPMSAAVRTARLATRAGS
jgi:hypothetical protein